MRSRRRKRRVARDNNSTRSSSGPEIKFYPELAFTRLIRPDSVRVGLMKTVPHFGSLTHSARVTTQSAKPTFGEACNGKEGEGERAGAK